MNVTIATDTSNLGAETPVAVAFWKGDNPEDLPVLDQQQKRHLATMLQHGAKPYRLYQTNLLYGDGGRPALIVGADEQRELDALTRLRLAGATSRYLTERGFSNIAFVHRAQHDPEAFARSIVEGAIGGAYDLGIMKTGDRTERRLDEIALISTADRAQLEEGARVGQIVGEARNLARDMINRPPNEITPSKLAERAQQLAQEHGLACEVLDEDAMRQLGMGSLLGVSKGSDEPARVIVLRYGDRNAQTRLAFVGKGLTFDSGGLSLKTAEGMETMKSDMSGAAAVIAGMVAVARLAPKRISVTGYVGATENMPGGHAMRPGDVLTAMNGKTIEVLNTDAEGRLVLADVLAYAVKDGGTHIVDFATLTGAAMVALGGEAILATGRPMDWVNRVVEASDRGLDRAWPMPQYPEYLERMRSEVADLKNTGGRGGGALTAAALLGEFVGDVPWAHMDIAGGAFSQEAKPYQPKGATGRGVGTIVSLTRQLSQSA